MYIKDHKLTSAEEEQVLFIYEKLKLSFPDVKLEHRKEIIGIGEEGRHLMCYFSQVNGAVLVKFKGKANRSLNDKESIQNDMELTSELFKNNDMKLCSKASGISKPSEVSLESNTTNAEKIPNIKRRTAIKTVELDYEKLASELAESTDTYDAICFDLIEHINDSAMLKLNLRERDILLSRFGIYDPEKTLQELGEIHSISRERVRQIEVKAIRKMKYGRISTEELYELELRRTQINSKISESPNGFLQFLFLNGANDSLIKFICSAYFNSEIDLPRFKKSIFDKKHEAERQKTISEKSQTYNGNIYSLTVFPNGKRRITDEDFSRIGTNFLIDEKKQPYPAEPYLNSRILRKFSTNGTYKAIKINSLKIPFGDNFFLSDFQCLTYDNHLVLIEASSLLNMCVYKNVEKFKALREYCEKYGFGYLIMDERGNSFEHINDENPEFSEAILAEIECHGKISYPNYKKTSSETNATVKDLLALIKNHGLHFSFPFSLKSRPLS